MPAGKCRCLEGVTKCPIGGLVSPVTPNPLVTAVHKDRDSLGLLVWIPRAELKWIPCGSCTSPVWDVALSGHPPSLCSPCRVQNPSSSSLGETCPAITLRCVRGVLRACFIKFY